MHNVVIYGAAGYMGQLFTRDLVAAGIEPIVAGRGSSVEAIADELSLKSFVLSLDDAQAMKKILKGKTLLVNLAGPFAHTNAPLIEACIQNRCHYIDIAGEFNEMKTAYEFDARARSVGIMIMPGAGFGVVPTDIAAKKAVDGLPDATELQILYANEGGASRGTLKTVLADINTVGIRRAAGKVITAKPAESAQKFTVAGKQFSAVYNPWRADLFTAALSTGIGTISTYSVFPRAVVKMMKGELLWLRNLMLRFLLPLLPEGPTQKQLDAGRTHVKAIARKDRREFAVCLQGPEAYRFTSLCLREISLRILNGQVKPGFQTPSSFASDLLDGLPTVQWH